MIHLIAVVVVVVVVVVVITRGVQFNLLSSSVLTVTG